MTRAEVLRRTGRLLVVLAVLASAPSTGAQPPDGVQWTNLVHATPNGSGIQKTSGCGGCADAGGTSLQSIQGGNGFAEFVPVAGARLYAGLGTSATASTDPASIDFAFSFWPDGGWDIRERNVYRTEGRFAGGDVFRVSIESGAVTYYRNGAIVYSHAVVVPYPLVFDTTLFDAGASLASAVITPSPPPMAEPPLVYDAIADRAARPKPLLPSLGPAGFSFTDPLFGSRITRITDAATRPASPSASYRTPSGTHTNAWSADGRYFYVTSTDGTPVPFAFDPATGTAARLPASNGDGLTLRFFNEPTFSYITPGVVYGTARGGNLRSLDQYDIEAGVYSQIINLDALVPNLAGTYTGGLGASAGGTERLFAFFGGTSQDRHFYLVVLDKQNPANRRLLNTIASTVDGVPANIALNFKIHAAAIDRSGRFVTVYPTGTDLRAPRSAAPAYVWDLETNTFAATPLVQTRSGGHDAYGYGYRVNQDCCTASTWDAAQWQFRSLAMPSSTVDLIAPVLLPKEVYLADHPSWHNAQPSSLVPFLDATYRYGSNTAAWRAWDDEIIAVQTEGAGTGATVWRFAHHRSAVANDTDPTRISFWYTPRVNVSRDGRWALFTSNWEKTLGTDPRGEAGGTFRQDVFMVELMR